MIKIVSIGVAVFLIGAILDFLTEGVVYWDSLFRWSLIVMFVVWIIRSEIKDYVEEETPLYPITGTVNELEEELEELTERVDKLEKKQLRTPKSS